MLRDSLTRHERGGVAYTGISYLPTRVFIRKAKKYENLAVAIGSQGAIFYLVYRKIYLLFATPKSLGHIITYRIHPSLWPGFLTWTPLAEITCKVCSSTSFILLFATPLDTYFVKSTMPTKIHPLPSKYPILSTFTRISTPLPPQKYPPLATQTKISTPSTIIPKYPLCHPNNHPTPK